MKLCKSRSSTYFYCTQPMLVIFEIQKIIYLHEMGPTPSSTFLKLWSKEFHDVAGDGTGREIFNFILVPPILE